MKFGIREVCNVHFEHISGNGPDAFTIDTAKMSTLESASTTVYAQGGQGYARQMAWEGEKTLTFTVEDALLTLDSFWALTGAERANNSRSFKIYPTSFAGFYKITAETLFRDEDGEDYAATITIPRAKIQTTLNLSMAPTGDPASFTFTMDAFPSTDVADKKLLFSLDIAQSAKNDDDYTTIWIDTASYSIDGTAPIFAVDADGNLTLKATGASKAVTITKKLATEQMLTDLNNYTIFGTAKSWTLTKGTITKFYII